LDERVGAPLDSDLRPTMHMEKFKKVMRLIKLISIDIKLISMNRRLFWMHLEVHEVVQGAVHVHHDHHVRHVCRTVIQSYRLCPTVLQFD
jgi:hypothetical protein